MIARTVTDVLSMNWLTGTPVDDVFNMSDFQACDWWFQFDLVVDWYVKYDSLVTLWLMISIWLTGKPVTDPGGPGGPWRPGSPLEPSPPLFPGNP